MNPITEYLAELARQHAEELKLVGVAVVFGIVVIASNLALKKR